jgi:hypothetical protein
MMMIIIYILYNFMVFNSEFNSSMFIHIYFHLTWLSWKPNILSDILLGFPSALLENSRIVSSNRSHSWPPTSSPADHSQASLCHSNLHKLRCWKNAFNSLSISCTQFYYRVSLYGIILLLLTEICYFTT